MCSPPMLEMSKPSIRTGSSAMPSASRRLASDSTRRWRRCSRRSRSWSRASLALRSASSRRRRLSPRSATRTSTAAAAALAQRRFEQLGPLAQVGADDHRARHRRRGRVVLADELLGDLGEVAFGLVVEVEALALGEDAVADLEDLGVGVLRPQRRRRSGRRCRPCRRQPAGARTASWIAFSRSRCRAARSNSCCSAAASIFACSSRLDLAVAAGEEVDDRVDVVAVLLAADVADAGRPAALDVVVEAGAAGAATGLGALAGAELEELAEQVERLAHPLGAGEGTEVGAARCGASHG